MEKPKVLSGYDIVARGVTKLDASLPEVGLKDVTPNGSWLEQKQIQSAIEARKHLIEVERIQKCGTLSHAIWRDDLKLAEVTQKIGSHWQYLGHNVGKILYLRPEEALFLMELNCLLLKHNDTTVSLQKAYAILLTEISIIQYKVFASLSRLGYKVLKHKPPKERQQSCSRNINETINTNENIDVQLNIDETVKNYVIDKLNKGIETTVANIENGEKICKSNDEATLHSTVETHSDELKIIECSYGENAVESGINKISNKHSIGENNESQIVETEIDLTANAENKNGANILIDLDVHNVKNGTNKILNVEISQLNQTMQCDQDNQSQISIQSDSDVHSILTIEVDEEDIVMDLDTPQSQDSSNVNITIEISNDSKKDGNLSNVEKSNISRKGRKFLYYATKLKRLKSRQLKPSDYKTIAKHFDNIPELCNKEVVPINVPDEQYIPRHIFVNSTSYVLNMKDVRNKCVRATSVESSICSNADEVNPSHMRSIRINSRGEFDQNINFVNNVRFPPRPYFRPYNFWRPRNNLNYVAFNMFFQRPDLSNMYFQTRPQYRPRVNPIITPLPRPPNLNMNSSNFTNNNNRKRLRNDRIIHLNSIKDVAVRLKQLIICGNTPLHTTELLRKLLLAFNNKYKTRLRLTEQFDVVNDENIIDTIELDEDEGSQSKKCRVSEDSDKFNENLNKLRQLAQKLKDLENKDKCTSKHKRALSNAIKTFNASYDADIYMNKNYEVINKRFIDIASDSESDCIMTDETIVTRRKKVKNPFYILKHCSETLADAIPSTSRDNIIDEFISNNVDKEESGKYNQNILNTFSESWLPKENDFGRAEVVKKNDLISRFVDSVQGQYLFSFIENHREDLKNWLEAKISYLKHIEETGNAFQSEHEEFSFKEPIHSSGLRSLIEAEDSLDMSSALEKLRIIGNNNKTSNIETSLNLHFDVYNRDVANFRKTNPPKPHFRIICMEESSSFPSTAEVMALHSKYEDNVAIVFAIVGISSISYLQINPMDIPVYVAGNELE